MAVRDMTLSVGETLFILRRRSCLSQSEFAKTVGMTRHTYGKIERDCVDTQKLPVDFHHLTLDNLSPHERCTILRKRENLTQEEVASALSLSRFWVNQMELGNVDSSALLSYWNNR